METKNITVTKTDQDRLQGLFFKQNDYEVKPNVKLVEEKLSTAKSVDPKKIAPNVVTMNSKVRVKNVSLGKSFTLELVYPNAVDTTKFKISIFSPLGASMYGYAQGDEFIWYGGNGRNSFLIEEVTYQPESAGDYDL